MIKTYIESSNIVTPLGFSTSENFSNILENKSGIKLNFDTQLSEIPFPASFINNDIINSHFNKIDTPDNFTRFEKLAIISIKDVLEKTFIQTNNSKTLFILSTTKGNIQLLSEKYKNRFPAERLKLHHTAQLLADFFKFEKQPTVVSNACISGVANIIVAQRLIKSGQYDNVIINGTDILSRFVVSGFQSFLSLSKEPCKPFDENRDGLTLGEGSATLIVTKQPTSIEVVNGATSNDANHISGPSRTGEGLLIAINKTLSDKNSVDFISAHGTATPYNDDMESKAIFRAELDRVPVNSFKGYIGHTLGAAGVIESLFSIESLKHNMLINTLGCKTVGTSEKINVIQKNKAQNIKSVLKIASGFGGSNAAVLFRKHES